MASPRIEIVQELRALEQFCTFKAVRSGEEQERYMKDYLADIQDFPIEAIRKACADWRKSGSTKFPTSGQIIPMIRAHLEAPRSETCGAWRPLSDDAYDALSLPDKIRHRMILAQEARRTASSKAHGWTRNINEAPPIYRQWMAVADGHEAEARRLRGYLMMPRGLAAE